MPDAKNKPVKTFKAGCIQGSLFRHVRAAKKSSEKSAFISMNAQITKRYYDESSDEWKESSSFDLNDLPKLSLIAQKCYDYIVSEDKG